MKNPSNMVHTFSEVPAAEIPRSSFDRSHGYKSDFDAGWLHPMFLDEVLPGDTFNMRMTGFARLATPIYPIMDNLFMETFFFFVPNRLLWEHWGQFNGAQDQPQLPTDYSIPKYTTTVSTGDIGESLGLPTGGPHTFNVLPIRAYALIWNEWFRDQNLQEPMPFSTSDDGGEDLDLIIRRRGKRHDYFTSCLPFPQKGPSVPLPLGESAPVTWDGDATGAGGETPIIKVANDQAFGTYRQIRAGNPADSLPVEIGNNSTDPDETLLYADLANATAATINELRQAFQIQRLQERDARGGTRYTEIIRAHFGVISPDARLQRPEFLGGGSSMINITPVPQTSATGIDEETNSPQGNLASYGTVTLNNHGFTKSFTEHGYILGFINVRADLNYQQGINRLWSRETRFDFYWPALSHIGEQSVLNKEIFADGSAADDLVFGYQERYGEMRYKPSLITGKMRSTHPQTLDAWHLAQEFATLPALNDLFIRDDPPLDRCIAVPSESHFILDCYFNMTCARPMPIYGVPGMIDHF